VVPLDAKLGMPEGDTSYLLQKWSGTQCVKESYQESRATLLEILGFAPSVNCLEDLVARASEHAEVYFDQQEAVDPTTEEEILVATSDCKGVPMRQVDAPQKSRTTTCRRKETAEEGREERPEADGVRRRCLLGGPVSSHGRDVLNEILRKEKQEQRPKPQNKRLRAVLTREVDGQEVNAKDVVFDWLAKEVQQRDPQEQPDGRGGHGRRNEASRLAGTEDRPGDRHLGHLARDRILMGSWPTVFTAKGVQGGSVRGNLSAKAARRQRQPRDRRHSANGDQTRVVETQMGEGRAMSELLRGAVLNT
jgi:hypothetical protein